MIATKTRREPKSAVRASAHVMLARFCESSTSGGAPPAFRILSAGVNVTDKGDLDFTPRSAVLVMKAFTARKNPLCLYYEHEDRLPLEKRGGAPMKGACSAPSANLVVRHSTTGPELWAENVAWTAEAKRQITTGERRQISPVAAYDEETREVLEILNVSLCGEGATHNGTLLASRSAKGTGSMDEMIQRLLDACNAGEWEEAESIVAQMEATDGGGDMAKMVRGMMAKMKAPPPVATKPPAPADDTAAVKRLAASRDALAAMGIKTEAFDRAIVDLGAATKRADDAAKRSDRATVQTMIASRRDLFDVVDERQHMAAADPVATERHIASLDRKVKAGVVALSKGGEEPSAARPGGAKPTPEKRALTPGERVLFESFNRGKDPKFHITEEEYLSNSTRHGFEKSPARGQA